MEIAGLALASASAAHELFKCGQRIYTRIKDEKKLTLVLREFQMFDLEDRQAQLNIDIALAQGVLKSPTIDQEHKDRLERNWKRIKDLFVEVDDLIDTMIRNSSWTATRARHEARDKLLDLGGTKAISNAVQEFQSLVLAVRELNKDDSPLELSDNDFTPLDVGNRVFNSAKDAFLGKGKLTDALPGIANTPQWFLFESKPYDRQNPKKKDAVKQNVRILAQKLHRAQGQRGILRLIGFRDEVEGTNGAFQLVFASPFQKVYPDSLETYIRTNRTRPSLNFRINLCNQLATAVLQTMTLTLVHKNIRPENILLLPTESIVGAIGGTTPGVFLTGWQYARQVERGVTNFRGETTLQRKVYQHPERQLLEAEKEYSMAHDLYSLGVCMMEILTWESLLATDPPTMSANFIAAFKSLGLQEDPSEPYTKHAEQIQQTLIHMCDGHIPVEAGDKIARLVKEFLTCLDEDEDEDKDEDEAQYQNAPNDKDRRYVAVHFVDTALKTMRDVQSAI
ncbi:hypothetical protein K458DRAFT_410664 [Lentithecium fluviatile CBS 122367]|uniref:Protein kinase domain-containing protein n=1 Tax=Lentithecium fluviatile CBS 122367 TaxID=1168545 RepID=A0A6G1IE59_9PLEO|nr:hypothetical protein K458DRAFT_410664 [Lentithecium fluviatile CBS 122367]